MTSGAPAKASVDFYNQLLRLPCSDKEAIGHIEFRLRALQRKQPNDLQTMVALLQALTMGGKTSEAIDTADYLWGQRDWVDADRQLTFLAHLSDLGMFDRAKELAVKFLDTPSLCADPEFMSLIIHIAIGSGDLDLMRTAADWELHAAPSRQIKSFVEELRRLGLDSHFERHQATVQNVIYGHQCSYLPIFYDAEAPELSVYVYANERREKRRLLENEIDDALANYFAEEGIDPDLFVPLITTQVLDISALHAPRTN